MLNQETKQEWMNGWQAAQVRMLEARGCYRPQDAIEFFLRIQLELPQKERETPWQHGFVAALSAALGH